VIQGAGFDTRGYRFQDQFRGKRLFEVDHHGTQEFKKRRVAEVLGSPPDHVTDVEIVFQKDQLADALNAAGTSPAPKRFGLGSGVHVPERGNGARDARGSSRPNPARRDRRHQRRSRRVPPPGHHFERPRLSRSQFAAAATTAVAYYPGASVPEVLLSAGKLPRRIGSASCYELSRRLDVVSTATA
jgi:hypothetical protein